MNRWLRALLVTAVLFALFSLYLSIRREVYNLGIANKAFGSTASVVAGVTLLIGPLARTLPQFGEFLAYRRQLGIMAFLTGAIHVIISLFFIPERFNITFFLKEWPATALGLLAIGVWIYAASISINSSIQKMGGNTWTTHQQRAGHIAFVGVFLHLIFLKYAGWIEWFSGKTQKTAFLANPQYPPASLFVFLVMAGIIGYRVYLKLKHVRPHQ